MTRRQLIATLAILAAVGIGVQEAIWLLRPPPEPSQMVGPARSGYTLTDFTLNAYDDQGKLNFRVQAPSLQRRESDRSLFIDKPRFMMPSGQQVNAPPWRGNAEYGWVNSSSSLLKLMGKVNMHRKAWADNPSAELHTSDVTAWTNENRLATDKPAHMRQGDSTMAGIGLRANLDTNYLEILHDFHGTFFPTSDQ